MVFLEEISQSETESEVSHAGEEGAEEVEEEVAFCCCCVLSRNIGLGVMPVDCRGDILR